jgi:hypothetical protein
MIFIEKRVCERRFHFEKINAINPFLGQTMRKFWFLKKDLHVLGKIEYRKGQVGFPLGEAAIYRWRQSGSLFML